MIFMKDFPREPSRITREDFLAAILYPYQELRMRTLTPSVVGYVNGLADAAIADTDMKMAEADRLRALAKDNPALRSEALAAYDFAAKADITEADILSWLERARELEAEL